MLSSNCHVYSTNTTRGFIKSGIEEVEVVAPKRFSGSNQILTKPRRRRDNGGNEEKRLPAMIVLSRIFHRWR
jgi:hypothetical protein